MNGEEYRRTVLDLLQGLRARIVERVVGEIPSVASSAGRAAGGKEYLDLVSVFISLNDGIGGEPVDISLRVRRTGGDDEIEMDICEESGSVVYGAPKMKVAGESTPEFAVAEVERMVRENYREIILRIRGLHSY
ncbi:hypothetical protein [Streptomyces sp. 8L]|uniref:hypothetical protein n=1 Tax=Streptomyces sp. 8L TaxID=2877242 RepID=UPI001CD488BB|nr:hypothetical protein [Streptomyces sp. 8L]MCA1217214.1 hypothetical protein [Streptomyces sp. 8L]